jgi:sec-independent protein translocase protein TatA
MAGQAQHVLASMPGNGEWLIILVIGLLVFGRRLPEVARNLGKSVSEFKKGLRDFQENADELVDDANKIKNDVISQAKDASGLDDSTPQPSS